MPEGDTLHRAARRFQALVGERVSVETPHPRAAASVAADRLDGRRLVAVEAYGKNLVLRFEGGLALRSHLGLSGSWRVLSAREEVSGRPWLVVRGSARQGVLRGGARLELTDRALRRLGPDILAEPLDLAAVVGKLRAVHQGREVGEALLDQRVVAGIGNVWRSEALWYARLSPWRRLADVSNRELVQALEHARRLMRLALDGRRPQRAVYRRAGRPCPRCGMPIRSRGQGDANRTAYWCPTCQRGTEPPGA